MLCLSMVPGGVEGKGENTAAVGYPWRRSIRPHGERIVARFQASCLPIFPSGRVLADEPAEGGVARTGRLPKSIRPLASVWYWPFAFQPNVPIESM